MPKTSATLALILPPRQPGAPATRWLASALRVEILEGRLAPGSRLPATRDLARQYQLSRGTIVTAFEQLKAEGYVGGSVGSGTYVNRILPEDLLQVTRVPRPGPTAARPPRRRLSGLARRAREFSGLEERPTRAFRANLPALDLFPTTLWAQIEARRCRRATTALLRACGATGYLPLQEAVADYLRTSRGVRCTTQQVIIVSGVQEGLDLVTRLVLEPGDRICMEDPGYVGAALLFEAFGAKVSAIPVDGEGMRVPGASSRHARLAYVTPGHQFPTGICMSLPRRMALLEWARRAGAVIIEDDYDSEYRYAGRPMPALQGLDRHGVVLFAGSFSKVLFPALRLGYLVVPEDLIEPVAALRSLTARHPPTLSQAVLADFIADGHFGRHLRRMREIYAERSQVLVECVQRELRGRLELAGIEAGLQTACWLGEGIRGVDAAAAAARREVEVTPLSSYSLGRGSREGLQLGFAAVDVPEIRRGVRDLAIALGA
jgi:GntR family transcriptional regulator/MocR family aminotransferase